MSWVDQIYPEVHHAGCSRFGRGVVNGWRVIYDHELFLFEEGAGRLSISDREYICPSDSFIIIPCGQRHISFCETDSVFLHWAHFDWVLGASMVDSPQVVEPALPDSSLFHSAPEFVPGDVLHGSVRDASVYTLSRTLHHRTYSTSRIERSAARAVLLEMLVRLLVSEEKTVSKKDPYLDAEAMRMRLTEAVAEPLDVLPPMDELLSGPGKSYSRQERLFKATFGISPHQYLTQLRMERIRYSLAGSEPIPAIAESLGFKGLSYFSRYVKKNTGLSPRELRNNQTTLPFSGDGLLK